MVPCLETMSIMLIVIGGSPFSRSIPPTVPCMSKGLQFHLQVILRNRCFLQQEIRCVITIITIVPQGSKFPPQPMPISITPICPKLPTESGPALGTLSMCLKMGITPTSMIESFKGGPVLKGNLEKVLRSLPLSLPFLRARQVFCPVL